jgi:preprotein translocase subunit SecY
MCITLLCIKKHNFELYKNIKVIKNRALQLFISWGGILLLCGFLIMHIYKDLTNEVNAWYFHSTYVWLIVMGMASVVFIIQWNQLKSKEEQIQKKFKKLPSE